MPPHDHQDAPEKHGLFRLSSGSSESDTRVDIVAIHGLGGDAFKTWTNSDGHLWLRDSLPSHVPQAGVLTYGYDSAFLFSKSKMRIHNFAIDLLSRLRIEQQKTPEKEQRLIFICHSLGGLVLKQALITASLRSDLYGSIFKNIYGVVFMATPHQGSRSASLGRHLSRIVNMSTFGTGIRSELLQDLELSSGILEQLSHNCVSILNGLAIVSFYEQKPLGPSMIVEPFSAILGLPKERAMPINADHRRIACPSPRSEHRYLPVWKTIAELVDGCLTSAPSEARVLLDALYCADYKKAQLRPRKPHTNTSDWLYAHSSFASWANCNMSSTLWLSGPAGVGKSVLTRCLLEAVLAGDRQVPLDPGYKVINFFCSYHDAAFSSEEIVLRSLLHQLLQINPQCHGIINNRLVIRTRTGLTYNLSREYLWVAFEEALALDSMRHCLIVLDAIEELPTDVSINLLTGLYNISTRFNMEHRNHRIRTFVSSRHKGVYNTILDSPFSVFFVRLQSSLLKQSIETFVRENVEALASTDCDFNDSAGPTERRNIIDKIVLRADGMFLWATIAWDDFKRCRLWSSDVVKDKIAGLDNIPNGINALYDRLISQVQSSTRKIMWTVFSILAVSARPLYEPELEIILALKTAEKGLINCTDLPVIKDLKEMIETEFPDMVVFHDDNSITFTHLSFKEYLFQYWTEKNPEWLDKARSSMAQACLTYLDLRDLARDAQISESPEKFALKYPFFQYAFNFYLHHLSSIPFEDELWLQFADLGNAESIFTAPWIFKWKAIDWTTHYSIAYASPLLAAIFHFESKDLVKSFANHGYDLDEKWQGDSHARTALNFCCGMSKSDGMRAMASLLLNLGASPNDPDEKATTTCLQHCIETGAKELFESLLRYPAINLNIRNRLGRAVLHSVVQHDDRQTLTNLLENADLDINVQDALGYTPLHLATMLRKLNTMRCLLQAYGIRLDLTDKQGRTPLTMAAFWGFKDAAVVLIDHSQAFPTPERDQLSSLVCAAKQGDLSLTKILLEKYRYANLNFHMDLSGKGVLHHAAANDWADILEDCLSRHDESTNINQVDHSGGTALHCAAEYGNTSSCKVLLKYGASLQLQDRNGRTAAHAAADAGFKDTLMCLLQREDIDVNQRDLQGRNLIHWAATLDCVDVMKIIIRQPGAELFRKDNMSLMPVNIAFVCQCPNVGKLLTEQMLSQDRARYLTYLSTFHWNSMYCSPTVSGAASTYYEVREPDLLTREHHRRRQNEAEWEAVRRQYPEHLWALTRRPAAAPKTSSDSPPPEKQRRRSNDEGEYIYADRVPTRLADDEKPTSYESRDRTREPQNPRRPPFTPERPRYYSSGNPDQSRTSSQSSGTPMNTGTSGYYSPPYVENYEDKYEDREDLGSKRPEQPRYYSDPVRSGTAGRSPIPPVQPRYHSSSIPVQGQTVVPPPPPPYYTGPIPGQSPVEPPRTTEPAPPKEKRRTRRTEKPFVDQKEQSGWQGFKDKLKPKRS